jgi:RNA 2',3'-cyclic 3'-phosphodiesterase
VQFPLFGAGFSRQSPHDAVPFQDPLPNMLYVVLKPAAELAKAVWNFPEAAASRPPELLHVTIQPIGSRNWITDVDIDATRRVLSRLRYAPFLMLFDRVEGGNSMALRGGIQNCVAQDFRLAVLDALSGHFRQLPRYELRPHMTLNYRGEAHGRLLDQPIAWLIEEFQLIESVHGETRHIEWGRWRLRDG